MQDFQGNNKLSRLNLLQLDMLGYDTRPVRQLADLYMRLGMSYEAAKWFAILDSTGHTADELYDRLDKGLCGD